MKEIKFSVAAKAARLIGRENIADVDGALVELIKNAYDADATCALVKLNIPFPDVPNSVELSFFKKILQDEDLSKVLSYYELENGFLSKKEELTEVEKLELQKILFSYNSIIIADNGSGMSETIVETAWMQIGTNNKEVNYKSGKGRIKTGAKGIGRFALDKLSEHTIMYTKSMENDSVIRWSMDWEQFAKVSLIDEVKAEVVSVNHSYKECVSEFFSDFSNELKEHPWETGTMIVLSPTREVWSKRLFKKVNTNMSSINPISSVDKFDVIIDNVFFEEYSYRTAKVAIDDEDFDYRLKIDYDGDENLIIKMLRNEVDLGKKTVKFEKYGESVVKKVDEFWALEKFQISGYTKEDYAKEIIRKVKVADVLKEDELSKIRMVGSFSAEMYFLRNANSVGYEIMKKVSVRKRKRLLEQFSGIKIYRDDFKVRPYGDEGALYDWINLGVRVQKSPAAVSHLSGRWRVEPYQMIGWVKIGRETNPLLEDMANREGLALNDYYYIFVDLLQAAINEFEYDRQYIYREYAKWRTTVETSLGDSFQRVVDAAKKKNQQEERKNTQEEEKVTNKEENDEKDMGDKTEEQFSSKELFGTVQHLVGDQDKELKSKQILQVLSASGVILNTFFHEFNAINTQFHVQASQIRSRVKYLLAGKEYTGLPAYNPYARIDILEKNDRMTAAFLDVVMEGLKSENQVKRSMSLQKEVLKILENWQMILQDRNITIKGNVFDESMRLDDLELALVDVYIILNNFLLNSAWFLESAHNPNREIYFDIFLHDEKKIRFVMGNNGPGLAEKYKDNPERIFELGETTKGKSGTGLGLWIVKETVERNSASISVSGLENRFELTIMFERKVKINV